MIYSMTAFARRSSEGDWGQMTLELRSVNHRYLEQNLRLPEELRALEPKLRERLAARLGRGKLDLGLRYQAPPGGSEGMSINKELVNQLAHASREVDSQLYNPSPISSLDVLKWPGVLQSPAPDPEVLQAAALALLEGVIDELVEVRGREGEKLKAIVGQRLQAMGEVVSGVRQRMPEVLAAQRTRLEQKLAELSVEVEPGRLEQELVLLVQKADVDEEMDRLETHIGEVARVLEQNQPVGRRLDFLMQELNREANTLGSKSIDTQTTNASVELKVLIEQMREQIQNIE